LACRFNSCSSKASDDCRSRASHHGANRKGGGSIYAGADSDWNHHASTSWKLVTSDLRLPGELLTSVPRVFDAGSSRLQVLPEQDKSAGADRQGNAHGADHYHGASHGKDCSARRHGNLGDTAEYWHRARSRHIDAGAAFSVENHVTHDEGKISPILCEGGLSDTKCSLHEATRRFQDRLARARAPEQLADDSDDSEPKGRRGVTIVTSGKIPVWHINTIVASGTGASHQVSNARALRDTTPSRYGE